MLTTVRLTTNYYYTTSITSMLYSNRAILSKRGFFTTHNINYCSRA